MRAIILSSFAALALVGAGCTAGLTGSASYGSGSVASRDLGTLTQVASAQMGCPAQAIEARAVTDRVWETAGCGQVHEFTWSDRRGWQALAPVGAFASNELSCPTQSLVVHAPQQNVRSVTGCGQRATYELACDVQTCAWTMTERELLQRPGVVVTPPTGRRPGPYATRPGVQTYQQPSYPPSYGQPSYPGTTDPGTDASIRGALDARRGAILQCSGGQPVQLRARWGSDGRVWLSVASSYQSVAIEQCLQQSVGAFQVSAGRTGELIHVVR